MMNAFRAPEALHIRAQDGEGNERLIRYIREDIIEEFVRNAAFGLERIKDRADRVEPYNDNQSATSR